MHSMLFSIQFNNAKLDLQKSVFSYVFQLSEEVSSTPRLADKSASVFWPCTVSANSPVVVVVVCVYVGSSYSAAAWLRSEMTQSDSSSTSREVSAASFLRRCSPASSSGMCGVWSSILFGVDVKCVSCVQFGAFPATLVFSISLRSSNQRAGRQIRVEVETSCERLMVRL